MGFQASRTISWSRDAYLAPLELDGIYPKKIGEGRQEIDGRVLEHKGDSGGDYPS